jgi:hypothetical protein
MPLIFPSPLATRDSRLAMPGGLMAHKIKLWAMKIWPLRSM